MMKHLLRLSVLIFALPLQAQHLADWENPAIFERGQEAPHATLMPYENKDQALDGLRKESPCYRSLNGTWAFHWAPNLQEAPADFYRKEGRRNDWQEISVPSNWQMEGFGYPLFRNIGLPHPLEPPEVPEDFNPVGSYFRTFQLPENWADRQVFLHFEGVHSASYVWVNGQEAGYNQGGMEPAEYDITELLNAGENSIAVRVLRYSDGSYLEDQDTWRLSGIYRDVYLMVTPEQHIRDFYVKTELDEAYRHARLDLQAELRNYSRKRSGDMCLKATLFDEDNVPVPAVQGRVDLEAMKGSESRELALSIEVPAPRLWSAEYPHLYTLVMELCDEEGKSLEFLSTRVGFRELEVKDQAFLVNGVPVKFNGVNSHMMHPETGHAMDVETMRRDLHIMKRFNINCVRTSHYPPNVEYLDLADELGIYIVDETGDEAHAYIHLSHNPEWREQYLDRMRKMVYRDRNHPSVVIWSAGNESGSGDNICALMEEGKQIDPSRPAWLYGGNNDEDPLSNPITCEDMVGPRYLKPFMLEQRFAKSEDPRPSFMDEYIAATGNSLGALDEYWELIRRYPRLTGGAIWDWISPGITMPIVSTKDASSTEARCVFINKACLVDGEQGRAMYLSGHDDWLEIYRHRELDITGEALSLSFWIRPEAFNGNGAYLTKGDYQFGIVQQEEDLLSFYLNPGEKTVLKGRLPADWVGKWHHVAGIYDGSKMELYVDGEIIGTKACSGSIQNAPYPVCVGKSAEMRDVHQGYMSHATIDRVRIFGQVVDIHDLEADRKEELLEFSSLWLDFENTEEEGDYWSIGIPGRTYGLVWPDRSIQPELWQLKKSPQPVGFLPVDPEKGLVTIRNYHHFRHLDELEFTWELQEEGSVIQKGKLDVSLSPGESGELRIPLEKPQIIAGKAYHLLISARTRKDQLWAAPGHEVAWEQFELPWYTEAKDEALAIEGLHLEESNRELVVRGEDFSYSFDREQGILSSMQIGGKELIRKGPRMNVWRAPLANDLDTWSNWHTELGYEKDWMGMETANGWRSAGLDQLACSVDSFSYHEVDGRVELRIESTYHAENYETGFKVISAYSILGGGEIILETRVSPRGFLPRWIPKMGLQVELPSAFRRMEWFGRGPFETYPDRKTGARIGRYRTTAQEDYVPYIIPQDYGNKCDVRWLRLSDEEGYGLEVESRELFNVSVQPFSTDHLDRAHYPFQLQQEDLLTLNLDHQVTGVGGTAINVLNPYRVFPEDMSFTFRIKPLRGRE